MNNKLLLLLFALGIFFFCSQVETGKQKVNHSARAPTYSGSTAMLATRPAINDLGLI